MRAARDAAGDGPRWIAHTTWCHPRNRGLALELTGHATQSRVPVD